MIFFLLLYVLVTGVRTEKFTKFDDYNSFAIISNKRIIPSHEDALSYCKNLKSGLATIETEKQLEFIKKLIREKKDNGKYIWLALLKAPLVLNGLLVPFESEDITQ